MTTLVQIQAEEIIVFETPSPIHISVRVPSSKQELVALLEWLDRHARLAGISWPEINEARRRAFTYVTLSSAEDNGQAK